MNNKKFNPYKRLHEESSIQNVLDKMIEGYNLEKGFDKINVKDAWIKLLGPGIANYTLNVELKRNTLYVSLSSNVLREELSYGLDKIKKMINDDLGKQVIDKIILR